MKILYFQQNVLLKNQTTFKIGGPARYFVVAKNIQDLIEAIKTAQKENLPYFILGGGSNVLVSDKGFNGLVIKLQNTGYRIQDRKIMVEAGTSLGELVIASVKRGLTGLEWAVGIPGTIGGAIRGNAGAFGHSISESVIEVQTLVYYGRDPLVYYGRDPLVYYGRHPKGCPQEQAFACRAEMRPERVSYQNCKFDYRDSIFKQNNHIILSAKLQLKRGHKKKSQQMIKEYLKKKKMTQPLELPSAGCIFKNPTNQRAGYLIEHCGLKGKKIGQAMISKKHANFIVNLGGAQAKDVIELIKIIKKEVKKKFNIDLEEEIQYVGG